jgi:hypothetical protein
MAKTVNVITSAGLHATPSEILPSNVLRVECAKRIITGPAQATRLNICVHNNSSAGRMASLVATYDQTVMNVILGTPQVYVAPNGKTVVQAIIQPLVAEGSANIQFSVH